MPELQPHAALPEEPQRAEAADVVLTEDDRRRISRILQGWRNGVEYRLLLREMLRGESRKAAAFIFEQIENEDFSNIDSDGGGRLYFYIKLLRYCVTDAEAQKLGQVLLKDEVAMDPSDRSSKSEVLGLLQKNGTVASVEQIVSFSNKTFDIDYGEGGARFIKYDNLEAIKVLIRVLERSETNEERQKVLDAINDINQNLTNHGMARAEFIDQICGDVPEAVASLIERGTDLARRHDIESARPHQIDLNNNEDNYLGADNWDDNASDQRGDDMIAEDLDEWKFEKVESRLETVKRLRHEARIEKQIKEDPEDDDTKFLRRHYLEYREENPSPLAPTMGIEIEIRSDTVVPKEVEDLSHNKSHDDWQKYYDAIDKIKEKYKKSQELGVPHSFDKFWEFSHKPVKYYHTLSREVQALIGMGLINKEDKKHPLHLTLGGIEASEAETAGGAYVLARMLEATGWATRGMRLLKPYNAKRRCWAVKGYGGVKDRLPHEMQLGVERGVEFRTFQLQTLTGLDRFLRSAFLLGAALKAYQHDSNGFENMSDDEMGLYGIWSNFCDESRNLFKKYDLSDPETIWRDPDPYDKDRTSEFVPLANLLEEAIADPESRGAQFVKEARKLVIKTRAEVAKIVYGNKPEKVEAEK